jgi:hypothetical protein
MMAKEQKLNLDDQLAVLKYILVVELWRAGLSQESIKKRLGMSSNTINAMLKGLTNKNAN